MTPLTVSNALVLSFVVFFLSLECVFSQTLDQEIAALPTCSTTCLTKAAANVNCGAGDFICQCQHQDGIVGVLGRVSSQVTCLIGDCGISNATTTRVLFKKICSILGQTSSSTTTDTSASTSLSISSPDQVLATSTTTSDVATTSSLIILQSTVSTVPTTSILADTTRSALSILSTPLTVTTSSVQSTLIVPPTSTSTSTTVPIPISTSVSAIPILSSIEQSPMAVPAQTSVSSSTTPSSTLNTSYTSSLVGAAKMSPYADSNSYSPVQAGEASPITAVKTSKGKLSTGSIVGIVIGAIVVAVAILGTSVWICRKRKMNSAPTRKFIILEEKDAFGPSAGEKVQSHRVGEKGEENEKALPPHPETPKTPGYDSSSTRGRGSTFSLHFESSPAVPASVARSSHLQPTTYNPAMNNELHFEPGSFLAKSKQQLHQSTASSFVPSNTAHKSAASSFFASIPILLDSREGYCDDCLDNREKYRSVRPRSNVPAAACTCTKHHGHAEEHGARGVSEMSITRQEVEEELLVGRVPTLFSERGVSGISRNSKESQWVDELILERELSKISEESDVDPLRSNLVILPPRPLFTRQSSSQETFNFGFQGRP